MTRQQAMTPEIYNFPNIIFPGSWDPIVDDRCLVTTKILAAYRKLGESCSCFPRKEQRKQLGENAEKNFD